PVGQHGRGRGAVVVGEVADDVDVDRISRLEPQLPADRDIADLAFVRRDAVGAGGIGGYAAGRVDRNGVAGPVDERVAAARRIDAAEVEPLDIAALALRHAGKPRRYRLGQAEVGAGAQIDAVAAAIDGLDVAGVAAGRPLREQS